MAVYHETIAATGIDPARLPFVEPPTPEQRQEAIRLTAEVLRHIEEELHVARQFRYRLQLLDFEDWHPR